MFDSPDEKTQVFFQSCLSDSLEMGLVVQTPTKGAVITTRDDADVTLVVMSTLALVTQTAYLLACTALWRKCSNSANDQRG
mmetsp:Transcript_38518/g.73947  ORF Transcript_38518/g.73947 Transcript_38518/m.73947 type:complete len:81 (-) Transcript_38518:10-252(-)